MLASFLLPAERAIQIGEEVPGAGWMFYWGQRVRGNIYLLKSEAVLIQSMGFIA